MNSKCVRTLLNAQILRLRFNGARNVYFRYRFVDQNSVISRYSFPQEVSSCLSYWTTIHFGFQSSDSEILNQTLKPIESIELIERIEDGPLSVACYPFRSPASFNGAAFS